MQLPSFKNEQNQYYSQQPADPPSKLKVILIGFGVALLLLILGIVVFGGKSKPGQLEMQQSLQAMSQSLGVIDANEAKLKYAPTQNDMALTKIVLRGNFQSLTDLYNKTYPGKKRKATGTQKPDAASQVKLDQANRNNTLDTEIIEVLKPKITAAQVSLKRAKSGFKKPSSVQIITTSLNDLESIQDILNRPR